MIPALELSNVSKRFGPIQALDDASFSLAQGEIHGLIGENGAGKTTLMQVAFGLVHPDKAGGRVFGQPGIPRSPKRARALGIGMVHQHSTSVPALTVRENLWLAAGKYRSPAGSPPAPGADLDAAHRLQVRLWEGLDPNARAGDLSVGMKQRLEILQALATGAKILLLDEPTAVLTPAETEALLDLLKEFTAAQGSAVLITHKLDEVLSAVDRVTVMRRGRVVLRGPVEGLTSETLALAMVGERQGRTGHLEKLGPPGELRGQLGPVPIRAGEIVGVAAVEGNGQRELLRELAGIASRITDRGKTAFLSGDRTTEGIIPALSLTENLMLGLDRAGGWSRGPLLLWRSATRRTLELLKEFQIRAPDPGIPAGTLSGGNQQRLVLARIVEANPELIVSENPTRGLDVAATAFVHDRLRQLAARGVAIVFYSTDIDEVLGLATRVVVVRSGRVIELPPSPSKGEVGAAMLTSNP